MEIDSSTFRVALAAAFAVLGRPVSASIAGLPKYTGLKFKAGTK
jgi:hypothetical protein